MSSSMEPHCSQLPYHVSHSVCHQLLPHRVIICTILHKYNINALVSNINTATVIGYSSDSWKPLHQASPSLTHHSTRASEFTRNALTLSDYVATFGPSLPMPSLDFSSVTTAPTSTTTSHGDCRPPSPPCTWAATMSNGLGLST